MHDNREILLNRARRTLRERIIPAQYEAVAGVSVSHWIVPACDGTVGEPVAFEQAKVASYKPIEVGSRWGKPWETVWFRLEVDAAPLALKGEDRLEVVFDLGWLDKFAGFQCEALVRSESGQIVKALNPRNNWIPVPDVGSHVFYVEAAANPFILPLPLFPMTEDGDKLTSGNESQYRLARADLAILRADVYSLAMDLSVLVELAETTAEDDPWGWKILLAMSDALDLINLDDVAGTASAASEVLKAILATPAYANAHRLSAMGHAHIDSAWLWPIRETRRKVTRTIANVVRLIEDGTGLIFALPAAQHVAWLKEEDPDLFARVKKQVEAGAIVPVGGMWVEPDAVLPGGEAMCRQLTEGLDFFESELGATCKEIWLPDSFGYSGALPQIARLAGIDRFLTQKISWNQVDTFPHHTLMWEGIDGSRIFTHFPPADTYGSEVTGQNLAHAASNFKDKGRANSSALLFGYGDGGGGPTREMMERIKRFGDLAGAARTVIESPAQFFERAQAEYKNPPVWVGELYLELHRGTFTSQIETKRNNRRAESLLREAELWATMASVRAGVEYPHEQLQAVWRDVLLCQFHDILPGTSVAWVYREVAAIYDRVQECLEAIIARSLTALVEDETPALTNASSFTAHGVPALSAAAPTEAVPVQVRGHLLENEYLRAQFDEVGLLTSLVQKETGREYVPAGQRGGELHLFQDFPNEWDAWDLDPFYRGSKQVIVPKNAVYESTDGAARVRTTAEFSNSKAEVTWTLQPGSGSLDVHVRLDWHESEKILKLAMPVDIHTDHAQYETQMGYITRPTHENTSWEAYKFEVSAHRWLRLADTSASLAITNDATYGWSVARHSSGQRGTWSEVSASLARASRFPDPHQDQGVHEWNFQLVPAASIEQAVALAQMLNLGQREVPGQISPLFTLDGAVVESVRMVDDGSGDVIIRAYEASGGRALARLVWPEAASVRGQDLRYRDSDLGVQVREVSGAFEFNLDPFEIATLRVKLAN
ncbi:glycoside hydrolase family 38 C-terminal domain-containing protein [Actinomyces sp.]|uniref:alpha-mannosidase n=1 Tax=Actinomyces sp. TaxID=29317 RepID=UPI00291259D4|nr:glycoside hydrolase family 38 C-terminal domain-containing protein [Actinomyces sp.]MDU5568425.1 glycoside hydrolase family 38 C-terminal domain-containing protein [Actinomyces sp.]MDU7238954.1 glycoside hydrolase family 38 C-terminal domain-containing protein [Actinomyces sp.]